MENEFEERMQSLEDRISKIESLYKKGKFTIPSLADVYIYMQEKLVGTDDFVKDQANMFMDHYVSNGWRVGKVAMKDWKAAVRNWVTNIKNKAFHGNNYSRNSIQKPIPKGDVPRNGFGQI